MNPIFYENKIELCDAVYEGSGSGWGISDDMRDARFSINPDHPEVKEILEKLKNKDIATESTYDFFDVDDLYANIRYPADKITINIPARKEPKKYSPKKISSKK